MQNDHSNHVVCGGRTTYQTTRPRDVVRAPKGDHVPRSLVSPGGEAGMEATEEAPAEATEEAEGEGAGITSFRAVALCSSWERSDCSRGAVFGEEVGEVERPKLAREVR